MCIKNLEKKKQKKKKKKKKKKRKRNLSLLQIVMQGGNKNLRTQKLLVSVMYVKMKQLVEKKTQQECVGKPLARQNILVLEKEHISKQIARQDKSK